MKPIVPKKTLTTTTTESLEASFQKAYTPTTTVAVQEPIETFEEKVEKPERKTAIKAGNTEGVLPTKKKAKKTIVAVKREGVNRITLDIPNDIFQQMETHKEATGQTMKFLMVNLLKKFFAENQQAK